MAKITYENKVALNENPEIADENKITDNDMNEIKQAVNTNENKILLAISDTAPSTCATGDLYYNTTSKKIFEATGTNTWGTTGTNPTPNTIYILFDTKTTYSYDGTDLVSVGGGGAEIAVSTTEPTGDEDESVKLWINPNEAPSGSLNPISNTYGVAQDKGYSQEYLNGKTGITLWENNAPTNDFAGQTINITTNTCSTYEVYFKINKTLDYVKIEKVVVGYQGVVVMPITQGFFNGTTSRWMTSITNSAITFGDATTGSTTQNNLMIPIKVVGYK